MGNRNKNLILKGNVCNLISVKESDADFIVSVRNIKTNKYYFNQDHDITIYEQKKWIELYKSRDNDFYFIINSKITDKDVGTIRVYDCDLISPNGRECYLGSIYVDKTDGTLAPYAKDAAIVIIDFAFDDLKMDKVIIDAKIDNDLMNTFSKKLGCNFIETIDIRGYEYNRYKLEKSSYLLKRKLLIKKIYTYMSSREKQ